MVSSGEWTVDGSAEDLRLLSARLRATGQSGLKKNITKAITVATLPARTAVKAELAEVMPHEGGLNRVMAKTGVTSAVLTGPKSAGVVVRRRVGRRTDVDGQVRHPVFGNRAVWASTTVPTGWWERVLRRFDAPVVVALKVAQDATASEAGFV